MSYLENAKALRSAMDGVGAVLTDEQAVTYKLLYPKWSGNGVSYVVPDTVSLPAGEAGLFFRVRRVFRDSTVVCRCGETVLAQKKRAVMLPGEMEKLTVPAECIHGGDTLTVEVVPATKREENR